MTFERRDDAPSAASVGVDFDFTSNGDADFD
jgi:hypothetical protein